MIRAASNPSGQSSIPARGADHRVRQGFSSNSTNNGFSNGSNARGESLLNPYPDPVPGLFDLI
jgi:hypothetical protein